MENYDDGDNQPKLLPCHHSFCKTCLIHLTNGRNFIDCPSCRQRTTLLAPPPDGVISLQTNFYVNQMRELVAGGDGARVKTKGCRKHGHKVWKVSAVQGINKGKFMLGYDGGFA